MLIRRHTASAIAMHWFNAACWLLLLATGFAMLAPDVQPVGTWWAELWQSVLGAKGLLYFHFAIGALWVVVYAVYLCLRLKGDVLPFLREICRVSPAADAVWCLRKGLWLILGEKGMARLGVPAQLPPQGFYNAGQKWVALAAVACSVGLAITGAALGLALLGLLPEHPESLLQWTLLVHLACAAVMAIFLPIHIYMAALAPGEAPALRSMFTGSVPLDFIRHHNPLWHAELKKKGLAD